MANFQLTQTGQQLQNDLNVTEELYPEYTGNGNNLGDTVQYEGKPYVNGYGYINGSFDSSKWQKPAVLYINSEQKPRAIFYHVGGNSATDFPFPTWQSAVGTVADLYNGNQPFDDLSLMKTIALLGNIYVAVPVTMDSSTITMNFFPAHVYGQVVLDNPSMIVQSMQNIVVKYCDANGTWTDISANDAPNFYIFCHVVA